VAGAVLSIIGVLVVLARGEWRHVLELRLVAGDLFMILATIAWSFYSWMLTRAREPAGDARQLGQLPGRAGGVRRAVVGRLRGANGRWARSRCNGAGAGGRAAVCRRVPGRDRLPLLGRGRAEGRARRSAPSSST
jgi:hypothetical protein